MVGYIEYEYKCPKCGAYLGVSGLPDDCPSPQCPKCGTQIDNYHPTEWWVRLGAIVIFAAIGGGVGFLAGGIGGAFVGILIVAIIGGFGLLLDILTGHI